jgi:hypothetical protein
LAARLGLALAAVPARLFDRGDAPFRADACFFVVRGADPRRCFANLFASCQPRGFGRQK